MAKDLVDHPRHGAAQTVSIEGVVERGRQLGRQLGFPTANIALPPGPQPRLGVYATLSILADGRCLPGVANVGRNPTTGEVAPRLEVHLFGFDEVIYGQSLKTELISYLRPERKFCDVAALVDQMRADAQQAKEILGCLAWVADS